MADSFLKRSSGDEYVLDCLAVIAMLFFASLSLSYSFPLTSVAVLCFLLGYLVYRKNIIQIISEYLKKINLSMSLLLAFYSITLLSFFFHSVYFYSSDSLVRSAFFRAIAFNAYAFVFLLEINRLNLDIFLYKFARYTALAISLISMFSLARLLFCFQGVILEVDVVSSEWQVFLSSLVVDNNFYSLGVLAGIFSVIYLWKNGHDFPKLFFLFMWGALYYAASRRAVLVGLAVAGYFILMTCFEEKRKFNFLKLGKVLTLCFCVLVCWLTAPSILHNNFSPESKRNFFESLGFNYGYISSYLPLARFRYLTLLNENTSLDKLRSEFYQGKDTVFSISPSFLSFNMMLNGESFKSSVSRSKIELEGFYNAFDGSLAPTSGGRFERWIYAISEFRSYSWKEKIFGAGGKYHISFAKKFSQIHGNIGFDYPHNPFLSLLLYSGIIVMFLFIVVYVSGLSLFLYPNVITLGLFPAAHFFNSASLDLFWSTYHFPFMVIFALKLFELSKHSLMHIVRR